MQRFLILVCLLCVALGCSSRAPQTAPADDGAITQASVYENERYWPAIVALTKEWSAPGETKPLKAQYRGTLVRVEEDGRVRIDFGRHGRHDIPIDHTDLVQRANELRQGTRTKLAPNFVLRVGNSLVDPSSPQVRPHLFDEIARASGFLCIFADPRAKDFPLLAEQLAVLDGVHGVRTVLFPQSVVREDLEFVRERLQTLSWHAAFMYPQLSENYTLSLLGEIPERPRALLVSPEGRVLHGAEIGTAASLSALRQAVERVQPPSA
jgi:hypothetical protein